MSDSAIHNLEQQIADAVADQYDADSVIFDNAPTTGHGIGYAVTSDGLMSYIPKKVSDMDDVTITTPVSGEALVFDNDGNLINGTVSTVGSIDDLNDVDTTGKANGDSLRYDGVEWVAKPTTIALTQAEYTALLTKAPNTHYVITDAPNLNPTASDIEYSSGVTVKDKIDTVNARLVNARLTFNSSNLFAIPSGTPRPYLNRQITVLGRNMNNGAVYALWYDYDVDGFRISATLVGNAPSLNNTCDVQYFS